MGFLDKLFGSDPTKDLQKAQKLVDREPARAIELARRVSRSDKLPPGVSGKAEDLIETARRKLIDQAVAQADRAATSDYLEDAAEWLLNALEWATGDEKAQLSERRESLLEAHRRQTEEERQAELRKPFEDLAADAAELDDESDGGDFGTSEGDFDGAFDVLAGMLRDDLADRYHEQPDSFREAVVTLHEGNAADALKLLDPLVDQEPEDPARRLERGKAHLMEGDAESAREDFDVAWRQLGDEHIDLAGRQSLPGLWAEACLEAGEAETVIGRLAEQADPRQSDVDVVLPFARALMDAEKFDEALKYLSMATQVYPKVPDFSFLLSIVLDGQGRRREAIATLEASVRPSCATGNCSAPPKHLPSLRALTRLLLEEGDAEAARGYLMHVVQARGGRLGAEEHLLSAQYFRRVGLDEEAEEAEATAKTLAAEGPGALAEPLHSSLDAGKERIL